MNEQERKELVRLKRMNRFLTNRLVDSIYDGLPEDLGGHEIKRAISESKVNGLINAFEQAYDRWPQVRVRMVPSDE